MKSLTNNQIALIKQNSVPLKCKAISGGLSNQYFVEFDILLPVGYFSPALIVRLPSRAACARLLRKFRIARRFVPASSRGLFGGGFPRYSLRWLACFHCVIITGEFSNHLHWHKISVSSPCIRRVNRLFNE